MYRKTFALAAIAMAALTVTAQARPRAAMTVHCDDRGCVNGGPNVTTTAARGVRSYAGAVSYGAGRPAGCPHAWCGCWLGRHLGLNDRSLWLARNWARVGSPTGPRPGAVVVWRHHVGKVTAVEGDQIKVLSGNDGRQVRERWRSTAGVIAYRAI